MSVVLGSRLGHYEIRSQLGVGGMGEVYLALDMDLRRQVAIKVLRSEFTTSGRRVRRFQQEVRAASALNHPNILTIYEIGTQNSTYFIASEYIEGCTLREDMAARGQIKTTEVLDVSTQVASALVAAHAAGVVHRDIKPENIMLRHDRIVKVLDFGLAKLTEREITNTAATLLDTEEGVVMGTVRYMSPEQVKGMAVDGRTDVWSLGVVIHEMLTGRMPFPGETSTEVTAAILEREPQPLVSRGEEIPPELKRIVLKAMRKDCEERYQTIRDMFVDLKSLKQELTFDAMKRSTRSQQEGESTATGRLLPTRHKASAPSSRIEYLRSIVKSHKLGLVIAGVLILASASIAYLAYFARGSALNPLPRRAAITSIAVLPFVNASNNPEAEYLSDAISESLINSLSQLPELKVIARSSSFKFRGKEVNPEEVANALGVEAILTGRLIQLGDQLQISAELVDTRDGTNVWGDHYNRKAADLLAIQAEISRDISEKLRSKLTGEEQVRLTKRHTGNAHAYELYIQGRYHWNNRMPENFHKAIEYFTQAINVDPKYALAYAGLADCYVLLLDYDVNAPKDSSEKARAAALKALEIDGTLAEARTSLAFVKERYDWDFIGAENEYKRAIELNPNYPTAHQWYAEYLSSMGRHQEAIAENERAHELDPLSLSINVALGARYHLARRYDDAIKQLLKTVEMYPTFARGHLRLGLTYLQKKMYPTAVAELQKTVEISRRDSMSVAALAYAYGMSGQKAEAQKLLDEMTQRSEREYVSPYYIAVAHVGLEERDQALASLEKAYQDRDYRLRLLKADPVWDSLRSDPLFQDIQRRVGLPL